MGAAAAGSAAIVIDRHWFVHLAGVGCGDCGASRIGPRLADTDRRPRRDAGRRRQPGRTAAGRQPGNAVAASESGHAAAGG